MIARPLSLRTTAHRLYDLLLLLYPGTFRTRFGEEMRQNFSDMYRDKGGAATWLRILRDFPISFLKAHLQEGVSASRVIRGVAIVVYVPLGILFVIGFVAYFTVEAYVPFNPFIDTSFSPGFTMEGFKAVRPGMTANEVHALIGPPLTMQQGMPLSSDYACRYYSADGAFEYWDFAWVEQRVCFDERGIVTSKHSEWFYN